MLKAIKISATGEQLAADATGHAAVLVPSTGLMWSVAPVGAKELTHKQAEKACKALDLCGHKDWRLPTVEELFLLADRSRYSPAIDTDLFPGTKSSWYWTSSPVASAPADYAWVVLFHDGASDYDRRNGTAFVRAVRVAGAGQ
jgi:hypothetical protein